MTASPAGIDAQLAGSCNRLVKANKAPRFPVQLVGVGAVFVQLPAVSLGKFVSNDISCL